MRRSTLPLAATLSVLLTSQVCFADPNVQLLKAVNDEDAAAVKAALSAGANPNFMDPEIKEPILVFALAKGRVGVVEQLLLSGANPNIKIMASDKEFFTPVHLAIKKKNLPLVEILIKHGAATTAADGFGTTPLILAARDNQPEIVAYLLKAGVDINQKDTLDRTALHWAVFFNCDRVTEILLKGGANVNAITKDGKTPLGLAKKKGNEKMVTLLSAAGAK